MTAHGDSYGNSVESLGGPWLEGSGQVARRTNLVIAALLQQDFSKFTVSTLETAIEEVADVHSDETIGKYKPRVVENGPFRQVGPGLWKIE